MKHLYHVLPMAALLLAANTALAGGRDDCNVPMADWQPREKIAQMALEQGWTVRRIKIDDGCYEVVGTDKNGRMIEVQVHPATLSVLSIDFEDDDHEHEREGQVRPSHD